MRVVSPQRRMYTLDCSSTWGCAMRHFLLARQALFAFSTFFASSVVVVGGAVAQSPQQPQMPLDGRFAGRSPELLLRSLPVLIALDFNSDGVISKSEIASASRSLQSIDKNKDVNSQVMSCVQISLR